MLDQLEKLPRPVSLESAQSYITQISSLLAASPKVRLAGETLLATLTADQKERLSRYRAEVDSLLTQAAKTCLAATQPADLDATLKTLAPYQRPDDSSRLRSGVDYQAQQRAAQMFQFVTRWQDYLGASQSGDNDRANQALFELRNLVDPTLIPRSRLFTPLHQAELAKTATPPVPSSAEILADILTRIEKAPNLDELEPITPDIDALYAKFPDDRWLKEIRVLISDCLEDRRNIKTGQVNTDLFTRNEHLSVLRANGYCSERIIALFRKISLQLQRETLAFVFKDSGIPQSTDESVDAYILRVAQAAVAAENWEYALRTLEFYRALFPSTSVAPAWTSRELLSCTTYVAARQLDEAGQVSQAVLAYQEALRAAGRLTPVTLIRNRLDELKTTQPDAYAAAALIPRTIVVQTRSYPDRFNNPPSGQKTYLMPATERPLAR